MAVTFIEAVSPEYDGTRSPAFTFAAAPLEDDVIIVFVGAVTTAAMTGGADPTDWTNNVGASGTVLVAGTACTMACLRHVVTAAEAAASTVSWTLSLLWAGGETGVIAASNWRGVDTTTPINSFGTVLGTPGATPHPLAAVAAIDVTVTGGQPVRGIIKDGAGIYGAAPADHTMRSSVSGGTTHNGTWVGSRNTLTTAGVEVAAVNITPQNSDEYVSVTLVITPAVTGPNVGSASGSIAWAGTITGTTTRSGAASGAISWAGTSTGATVHGGAVAGVVDWVGSATGVSAHNGVASGAISWVGTATGEAPTLAQEGSAAGVITWAGTVTGTAVHSGTASGAVTWPGVATGITARSGAATGAVTWVGVAAGASPRYGAATGTVTWVGVVTGDQPALFVIGTTIATTRSATTTATVIVSDTTTDTIAPTTTTTEIAA